MAGNSRTVEMVWRCPNCRRIYREHVFEASTSMSGPLCNSCAVALVWIAVEAGRSVIGRREWLRMESEERGLEEFFEDEDE